MKIEHYLLVSMFRTVASSFSLLCIIKMMVNGERTHFLLSKQCADFKNGLNNRGNQGISCMNYGRDQGSWFCLSLPD